MKNYQVEIKGLTPLLQHRMPTEALFGLLGIKEQKKAPKEVCTPREIAERHCYITEDGRYYIPMEYICGAVIQASSDYKQRNSSRKSLKSVIAGAFRPLEDKSYLTLDGKKDVPSFEVDVRKATNHLKGAVAVCRPIFHKWQAKFTISINEEILSPEICHQILEDAGRRVGIGSFRVANRGYFGQFELLSWKEIKG